MNMPEFHLKRKRRGKDVHRSTLDQVVDQEQQLRRALEMYEEHNEIILGPNEISVDEAVAGRRVNAVDDNVIVSRKSSHEPAIKANVVRKISSKYSECIYLRYGSEMRRCPMPSPITLSTIKQLFVNMFDLSPAAITDPSWHLFILDRSNTWKPLEIVSTVYDHCTLLLVDSSDIGTLIPSPVSVDTRPSRCSTGTPDNELLFSPSPNELRPLSWNESSPESLPRPKSLDISMLPSVSGEEIDMSSRVDHPLSPPFSSTSEEYHQQHQLTIATSAKSPLGLQMLGFYNTVQHLKHEIATVKKDHKSKMDEMNLLFQMSKERLLTALKGVVTPPTNGNQSLSFREERLALDRIKKEYIDTSQKTRHDLSLLQAVVDELRVDAVDRRCKVDADEIDMLMGELEGHQSTFQTLQGKYRPFETKIKEIMKEELKIIVEEEKMVEEEPVKLEDSIDVCSQLSKTLQMLKQFSSLQVQRSPQVPIVSTIAEPDRTALMASISNIVPNHDQRMGNLKTAEDVFKKRRQELSPSRRALKQFEKSLKDQQQKLKTTDYLGAIEQQHEDKLKAFYMGEKVRRQQELEKDLQIREELKRRKKQKELELIKAKFQEEKEQLRREEERQRAELRKVKLEKERLERERKQNEEERRKLEELKRQQEEERKVMELKRQEELRRREIEEEERRKHLEEEQILKLEWEKTEERRRKDRELKLQEELKRREEKEEEEQRKRLEELRILETEREKTEERRRNERLKQVEEQLKLEKEREKMEEKKRHEENQLLLDELMNGSPNVRAKRKDFLWKQIQERAEIEMEEEARKSARTNQLRSHQIVMDSLTSTTGSTPTMNRKPQNDTIIVNDYREGHRSNPSLPQNSASDHKLKRLHQLQSFDTSYPPSDPLHRKLNTSLSNDLKTTKPPEPSYDTLEKIFKSEENVSAQTNHYDLPWHSKKLPFGSVQRRGTFDGSSPGNHKRNKSEGVTNDQLYKSPSLPNREMLTPSPAGGSGGGFHHTYIHTSHTPPPKASSLTSSNSASKIRTPPVYEDIPPPSNTTNHGSPTTSNESPTPDPHQHQLQPQGSLQSLKGHASSSSHETNGGSPYPTPPNGVLPSYSQIFRSNQRTTASNTPSPPPPKGPSPHRHRSHTTNARIATHQPHPLSSNPHSSTVKPSISYV